MKLHILKTKKRTFNAHLFQKKMPQVKHHAKSEQQNEKRKKSVAPYIIWVCGFLIFKNEKANAEQMSNQVRHEMRHEMTNEKSLINPYTTGLFGFSKI